MKGVIKNPQEMEVVTENLENAETMLRRGSSTPAGSVSPSGNREIRVEVTAGRPLVFAASNGDVDVEDSFMERLLSRENNPLFAEKTEGGYKMRKRKSEDEGPIDHNLMAKLGFGKKKITTQSPVVDYSKILAAVGCGNEQPVASQNEDVSSEKERERKKSTSSTPNTKESLGVRSSARLSNKAQQRTQSSSYSNSSPITMTKCSSSQTTMKESVRSNRSPTDDSIAETIQRSIDRITQKMNDNSNPLTIKEALDADGGTSSETLADLRPPLMSGESVETEQMDSSHMSLVKKESLIDYDLMTKLGFNGNKSNAADCTLAPAFPRSVKMEKKEDVKTGCLDYTKMVEALVAREKAKTHDEEEVKKQPEPPYFISASTSNSIDRQRIRGRQMVKPGRGNQSMHRWPARDTCQPSMGSYSQHDNIEDTIKRSIERITQKIKEKKGSITEAMKNLEEHSSVSAQKEEKMKEKVMNGTTEKGGLEELQKEALLAQIAKDEAIKSYYELKMKKLEKELENMT